MSQDPSRLVLVVEDDLSVRRPLVKFLEMHGFAVVTAETSDEGLEALGKNLLVAAVVDLRLKKGSGRDVVMATPAEVPVIIFSGVPSESAELERLRPRTRLIEKPYSLVLLVETLEEMLAESKSASLATVRLKPGRYEPLWTYRIFFPKADRTSSVPSCAVALRTSSVGLISTRSSAVSRPESAMISISMCASR